MADQATEANITSGGPSSRVGSESPVPNPYGGGVSSVPDFRHSTVRTPGNGGSSDGVNSGIGK